MSTRPAKEIVVRMPNEIGGLDRLAKSIADKGANVLGVCAWVEGSDAVIRLLTDDSVRVADALKPQYSVRQTDVLVAELPHKPGMLHRLTERLAQEQIDIHHLYAAASGSQDKCLVVFATANNDRAMVLLNASTTAR
ncbi:MAG: hypothetical protein HYU37_10960 [Acidobacteria bacterium]|nr:hypothetical protein [Acidobacteriota bacterium]